MKQPWSKFFWSDYDADEGLRLCGLDAQGLWMRMLCLMARAAPKGELRIGNEPCSVSDLAQSVGKSEELVTALLGELSRRGVYSVTRANVIYCRRMRNEDAKRKKNQENGKKGGNPNLSNEKKKPQSDNPPDNGEVKPQKPEARSHIPESSSTPSEDTFEKFDAALRRIPGIDKHPVFVAPVIAPIWQMAQQGYDLKRQIVPSIVRQLASRGPGRPIKSWNFFVPGIVDDNSKSAAIPVVDEEKWKSRLATARSRQQWDAKWGPLPHGTGCLVPVHLLLPTDGMNWHEWKAVA